MKKIFKIFIVLNLSSHFVLAQIALLRDTIPVFENSTRLNNAWTGGLNFCGFSEIDLNLDGKKDLAVFDKICNSGGKLRTFINSGTSGNIHYKHAPQYEKGFPTLNNFAYLIDYNNDGKEDLFTYVTGGMKVFKNTSTSSAFSFELVTPLLMSNYNPGGTPNNSNIYCNPVALPGIADIDNDGDIDVLSYSVFGVRIEFHKNMSQELYGHSDSLVFNMVDDCWGDIQESNCAVELDQCPFMKLYEQIQTQAKVMHAGSCIMCFDRDGDGDKDLLLGDVSCSEVFYTENIGSTSNAHIGDTTSLYPNYPNKSSVNRIKLNSFPCTYHVDINNDGYKDLIASPNSITGAENAESVWLYKNTSTTSTVNFAFDKKNFLQDEMIELGEGAYPALIDIDADGKKDLIIGNLGYYTINTNKSKLAYYKNIGTASAPSFSLMTRDFQNLSQYNLYSMAPSFGDVDGDGDQDLLIGDSNGRIHLFINSAGNGNPALFNAPVTNYANIDVGSFAYPQLVDVDSDGKLDLLIGSQNGRIAYYKNTGTATSASFVLQTNYFGSVEVKQPGYITGYSVPFLYKDNGQSKLIVGSEIGNLYYYNQIDGNLNGAFNRVDTNLYKLNEGTRAYPYFEDINNDGLRDLFLGNHAGGLAFYRGSDVVGINESQFTKSHITFFPNPATDFITLEIDNEFSAEYSGDIFDINGKVIKQIIFTNKSSIIDVSGLSSGVYFLKVQTLKHFEAHYFKIIISR